MGLRGILDALALGARNMVMTAILLCSVGLVVNVIATAGIGNTFSLMITSWSGDNMLIAILLIALASLILGMGLPVTAAYIVLGTLSAPALYNLIADTHIVDIIVRGALSEEVKPLLMLAIPDKFELLNQPMPVEQAKALLASIPPDLTGTLRDMALAPETATFALLSAHLIIFWLSQDSNVTPPVCLAAFTAAAIAKTPPMSTGLQSWKVAKGLYIIPLLFAYTPLIGGSWHEMLAIFIFALFGLYAFTSALQGHMENSISWPLRLILLILAFFLLKPTAIVIHFIAAASFLMLFVLNIRKSSKMKRFDPSFNYRKIDFPMMRRLLAIGIPAAFQYFFEVSAFAASSIMVGWMGTVALAAHQIALNLASISFMVAMGIDESEGSHGAQLGVEKGLTDLIGGLES